MTDTRSYLVTDVTAHQKETEPMTQRTYAAYQSDVHFRVPHDFMAEVHAVARSKGMTASSFMRSVIVEAIYQSKVERELVALETKRVVDRHSGQRQGTVI